MDIRRIAISEACIVQELAHQIWPSTFEHILSPEQITYMLDWMYNIPELEKQILNGHQFWLAEQQNPVGFIGFQMDYPKAKQTKIHKLYVLPNLQKSGIGRRLMAKAIDVGKEQGQESIVLNVNRFNPAVQFYTHLGFEIEREENIDIGQGFWMEDYVMRRTII